MDILPVDVEHAAAAVLDAHGVRVPNLVQKRLFHIMPLLRVFGYVQGPQGVEERLDQARVVSVCAANPWTVRLPHSTCTCTRPHVVRSRVMACIRNSETTTFSLMSFLMAETAASTGPLPVAMAIRSWSPNFSTTVAVRNQRSGGHLQEFPTPRTAVSCGRCRPRIDQVVIVDLLLLVGQHEELLVGGVQLLRVRS